MSDFELLKYYQQLLVEILEERQKGNWRATKTRFQRVRIETQKLMLKIERNMYFGDEM